MGFGDVIELFFGVKVIAMNSQRLRGKARRMGPIMGQTMHYRLGIVVMVVIVEIDSIVAVVVIVVIVGIDRIEIMVCDEEIEFCDDEVDGFEDNVV
ncbi:ribosomal protein L23, partial [Tanacetum coccineum]